MQTGTRHPHVPPRPKFRPVSAVVSAVLLRPFFFFFLHLTPTPTRIRVSRSGGGRRSGLLVRVESATCAAGGTGGRKDGGSAGRCFQRAYRED
uniref:Uncharacterized protein n=1 Tax=Fagus sylvatica TaxID=28930 RepID=A0A2N9FZD9_FAGSY